MNRFGAQFNGMAHPHPKGGPRPGAGRNRDVLSQHPEHGYVGSLAAIAREVGMQPSALHIRQRRGGFTDPVIGRMYSLDAVKDHLGIGSVNAEDDASG